MRARQLVGGAAAWMGAKTGPLWRRHRSLPPFEFMVCAFVLSKHPQSRYSVLAQKSHGPSHVERLSVSGIAAGAPLARLAACWLTARLARGAGAG